MGCPWRVPLSRRLRLPLDVAVVSKITPPWNSEIGYGAAVALAPTVDALYCANVRGGIRFAVAEAYEAWCDVDEAEALGLLAKPLH